MIVIKWQKQRQMMALVFFLQGKEIWEVEEKNEYIYMLQLKVHSHKNRCWRNFDKFTCYIRLLTVSIYSKLCSAIVHTQNSHKFVFLIFRFIFFLYSWIPLNCLFVYVCVNAECTDTIYFWKIKEERWKMRRKRRNEKELLLFYVWMPKYNIII